MTPQFAATILVTAAVVTTISPYIIGWFIDRKSA